VCNKIAEHFQDEDGCYNKYVMDIVPFCNGHLIDSAFEIVQLAIFFVGTLMYCMCLTGTSRDTYKLRSTIVHFGILIMITTAMVDVIKLITTFIDEDDMAKVVWELAMFISTLVVSCCCFVCCWNHPCIPASLCLPVLQIISEIIKNFATDDSGCFYPY